MGQGGGEGRPSLSYIAWATFCLHKKKKCLNARSVFCRYLFLFQGGSYNVVSYVSYYGTIHTVDLDRFGFDYYIIYILPPPENPDSVQTMGVMDYGLSVLHY